jgi:hypothetical protein
MEGKELRLCSTVFLYSPDQHRQRGTESLRSSEHIE